MEYNRMIYSVTIYEMGIIQRPLISIPLFISFFSPEQQHRWHLRFVLQQAARSEITVIPQ
jgi:hypothetical protein